MNDEHHPVELEDNDDEQVGTLLSRRRALTLLGSAGAVLGASGLLASRAQATSSSALPSCVVRPAQTQGPYFVDERLNRSDIRSDPASGKVEAGVPLTLGFLVTQVGASGCKPLSGVQVDVWQASALGHYSDIGGEHTKGQQFLRGYQTTGARGVATFQTVYPGWYNGRTVHIHFKLRRGNATFTSQLFFDEALTDRVYQSAPYNTRGPRTTRNEQDNIFSNGGHQLMLNAKPSGQGYAAVFDVGMNLK